MTDHDYVLNIMALVFIIGVFLGIFIGCSVVSVNTKDLKESEHRLMAKLTELEGKLSALIAQFSKGIDEVVAEIKALQDALSNVDIPAGAEASLAKLTTLAQTLDDLNPDQPPPPPTV